MKKKYFLPNLIFICILILECNNDDENLTAIPTPQNQKPGDFTVQITDKNKLLSWDVAVDPDDDKVTYTLAFIEDKSSNRMKHRN
ncbi:hypothetical protein [Aquimarina algiphila]|uniref:hypothetical protein n=1 Tax=Aquimarina algiphila TaxID=2047982 RepID=UPI00232C9B6C|nr:hypothetical protein [Aquimarina algiphila]